MLLLPELLPGRVNILTGFVDLTAQSLPLFDAHARAEFADLIRLAKENAPAGSGNRGIDARRNLSPWRQAAARITLSLLPFFLYCPALLTCRACFSSFAQMRKRTRERTLRRCQ